MSLYKHGTYGGIGDDIISEVDKVDAGVVYVGTAPINLVRGYSADNINKPVTINNIKEAKQLLGYTANPNNWALYTLCEAMSAHFDNSSGNIGPVHFINVLDPSVHISDDEVTGSLTFTKRKATITDPLMIVDSFKLNGKTEGTDYVIEYDMDKCRLVITDISTAGITTNTYAYSKVEMPATTAKTAVIGGTNSATGAVTGIEALKLVYEKCNVIPKIVLAPFFSSDVEVKDKLVACSRAINSRFVAQTYLDIPLKNASNVAIDTKQKALEWAAENDYNDEFSKVFFPMVKKGNKPYHISTKFAVEQMKVNLENDNIPYQTASNKTVDIDELYFGEDSINSGFDIEDANALNAKGITTAVYWNGNYRLWGGHTAAYDVENEASQGKEIFDTSIAMLIYLVDDFIISNAELIDTPMTVSLMESIKNEQQTKLDNLVSMGALVGNPQFVADDVTESDIKAGSFGWVLNTTPTSQFKDATIKVVYTDKGYAALLGGTANEEE